MDVGFICLKSDGEPKPSSRYLKDYVGISKEALFTPVGLETILRFAEDFGASGIMCIDERIACWLNRHKGKIQPPMQLWMPPADTIKVVLSKERQIESFS